MAAEQACFGDGCLGGPGEYCRQIEAARLVSVVAGQLLKIASVAIAQRHQMVVDSRMVELRHVLITQPILSCLMIIGQAAAVAVAASSAPAPATVAAPQPDNGADVARLIADMGLRESAVAIRDAAGWHSPRAIVVRRIRPDIVALLQPVVPGAHITAVATPEEALKAIGDADVLLGFCSESLIAAGKRLRWVQSFAAGVEDCVGAPKVKSGAVLLTNTQRVSGPVMSEYVIGALFSLARGLPQFAINQRDGRWDQSFAEQGNTRSLRGKTLLVVGLGGIGTEVARLANALGMKVIATRNTSREAPAFVSYVGLADELPALAARADAIVNTAPLTPATTGIFNAALFAKLKPTVYFINVGRGASVVTADLDAALRSGRIAGAAVDVTEPEPLPPENPLWHAPNIIITPHVSNIADLGNQLRVVVVLENLRRYAAGDHMLSVVEPGRGY
jgi:phosphoglycerate dehydrogenase-like enzyme